MITRKNLHTAPPHQKNTVIEIILENIHFRKKIIPNSNIAP